MSLRPRHTLLAVSACLALALGASAARAQASEPDAEPGSWSDSFEAGYAEVQASLAEIAALEADARHSAGDDRRALRTEAVALRLVVSEQLGTLVALVAEADEADPDRARWQPKLVGILELASDQLLLTYAEVHDALIQLKGARLEASGEEAVALDQRIARGEEIVDRYLGAGIGHAEHLATLGLPTQELLGWLRERVAERARLVASRTNLAQERLRLAEARLSAGGDEEALAAHVREARAALVTSTGALKGAVAQLERLELDTSRYKELLITTSGEITADMFEGEVAAHLLSRWWQSAKSYLVEHGGQLLFKTLVVLSVLVVSLWLAGLARRLARRAVDSPNLRLSDLLKRMVVSLSGGIVALLGLMIALSQLGVEVGPMLAGLGIAGFIVGFALQDTLGNFAAGIMILAYRPYDVGDMIDCAGGVFGEVSRMNLVSTTILTIDHRTRIVPNSKIWGDVITNVTAEKIRRVDMEFGIAYGDSIEQAEAVLAAIVKEHPKVLDDPTPMIRVAALGDSSVSLIVRPWANREDYWDVFWDVTREVKLRFDREGLHIPFPQRDVHVYREGEPIQDGRALSEPSAEA